MVIKINITITAQQSECRVCIAYYATVSQINKEGFRFGFCIQRYAPKAHTGAAPKYMQLQIQYICNLDYFGRFIFSTKRVFTLLIVYGGRFGHPAHYPPITALTSCVNGVIEVCPHVNNQQEIPLASKSAHF